MTLAIYWPVNSHDFVYFDDGTYISENPQIQSGLTTKSVRWAFTTFHAGNWHPLTWLSHMIDCQVYGLRPGGHHLTNLVLHVANTLLLFAALVQMTESLWRSAAVAALFAWHPLHVESVAWVAERKDVLSAFFWMLATLTYAWYVRTSKLWNYVLTLFCFALGLLSKPMVVTLPIVLLLLDYWPLRRPYSHKLLLEKIPFLVLVMAFCPLVLAAQSKAGAVQSIEAFPVGDRIANALVSYFRYIRKMIWPNDLAIFYPHEIWPWWVVAGAAVGLLGISALVIINRDRGYLPVGWLWFVGALVPVIGLLQVGDQAMADRYSYLPLIGLFIIIVWGLNDMMGGRNAAVPLILIVSACAVLTVHQVQCWKNSEALFSHAAKVTKDNYIAYSNLGVILNAKGESGQATACFREALRLHESANAHLDMAAILAKTGKMPEAIKHYRAAIKLEPGAADLMNNLAWILATDPDANVRNGPEAVTLAKRACEQTQYKIAVIIGTLAAAYAESGEFDQSIATAQKAMDVARAAGQGDVVARNGQLLKLYQSGKPFHSGEP